MIQVAEVKGLGGDAEQAVNLRWIHQEDVPPTGAAPQVHRGNLDDLNAGGFVQPPGRTSQRILEPGFGETSHLRRGSRNCPGRIRLGRGRLAGQGTERVDPGEDADDEDGSDDDPGTPQLTAFFRSATIFFSSAAFSSFSAKVVGHMAPSSRLAWSLKPNVAYLALNLSALWKKQTTLPSLA